MEYEIVKIDVAGIRGHRISKKAEDVLNEMGREGWRLVAVVPIVGIRLTFISSTVAFLYHFERPLNK